MRRIMTIMLLVGCLLGAGIPMRAQTYQPTFPAEPNSRFKVSLACEPSEAGNLTGGGWYMYGTQVYINTSARSSAYTFDYWEMDGKRYKDSRSFYYQVTDKNVRLVAHYTYHEPEPEPYNPAFPSEPVVVEPVHKIVKSPLYLVSAPSGACSFNRTSGALVEADQQVSVTAYPNQDFVFKGWYQNGSLISTSKTINYVMGASATTLTASFTYNPAFPTEPVMDEEKQEESGETVDNGQNGTLGDVNGDGVVNTADAVLLMNLYLSGDPEKQLNPKVCDVNGDGVVNTADAVAIMNNYLKQ
ncbi:MAG: dockerin type I repeat-containing protein [Bacteroidaceae bacterium]|nr:dockerin type I repeat-containing protein [Bacteroidaceae bacterium]